MKSYRFLTKFILTVSIISILNINGFSQQVMSLENALSITLNENISIKIKTNELDQMENNKKAGIIGTLPRIIISGSASGNKGTSSLEFATEDFPTIEDVDSESKSITGNVEISYNLFNGLVDTLLSAVPNPDTPASCEPSPTNLVAVTIPDRFRFPSAFAIILSVALVSAI